MIKTKKNKKNPKVELKYLQDLIGKKVILLVDNGYITDILKFRDPYYKLFYIKNDETIFSFTFKETDVKSLEFEEGGQYWINLRTEK